MSLGFLGGFDQKVDTKGRVSIPADFRAVLADGDPRCPDHPLPRLVVLHGPHLKNHLQAYTFDGMQEIHAGIRKLPRGPDRRQAERYILGHSWTTEIDKDGRIVLPQRLRAQIGLEGEAKMMAMGDHFEIWNAETFAEVEARETAEWLADKPEDFDPLTLLDPPGGA